MAVAIHQFLDHPLGWDVHGGGVAFSGEPVLTPVPDLVPRHACLMNSVGEVVGIFQQGGSSRADDKACGYWSCIHAV